MRPQNRKRKKKQRKWKKKEKSEQSFGTIKILKTKQKLSD
jgi:hypothetical protein